MLKVTLTFTDDEMRGYQLAPVGVPKDCDECPFQSDFGYCNAVPHTRNEVKTTYDKRPDNCPAQFEYTPD